MAINFLANGSTIQPTSAAMLVTGADIFTPENIRQSTPTSATIITTPPTFAGISGVTPKQDGGLNIQWGSVTSPNAPFEFQIFIAAGVVSAATLFALPPVVLAPSTATNVDIYKLSDQTTYLVNGQQYTVGVRCKDGVGNQNTNLSVLTVTAISSGNLQYIYQTIATQLAATEVLLAADEAAISVGLGAISVDLTAVKAKTDNLPADPASNTQVNTRATQTSVDNISTKIGTPVASVSADIAAVKAVDDTINTKIGTPAVSVSADIAEVETHALSADNKLGTPVVSVSDDIATRSTQTSVDSLNNKLTTGRANNLDNLDTTITSRATQSSIDGIQNNTNFVGVVPQIMDIPNSGSETYKFFASMFDTAGNPEDPDGNTLNYRIESHTGSIIVATTAMTRDSVGVFHANYTVNAGDSDADLVFVFTYSENSVAFTQYRTSKVQSNSGDLQTLLSRLTPARASNLDNLDATVSSRADAATQSAIDTKTNNIAPIKAKTDQLLFDGSSNVKANAQIVSDKTDYSLTAAEHDNISQDVWDESRTAHSVAGSFGESNQGIIDPARAANLDNLDAPVSDIPTNAELAAALVPIAKTSDITGLAQANYTNRMTTVYRDFSQDQEIIVWAERDGQRKTGTTNCSINVYGSQGNLVWSGSSSTPDANGVYRFINALVVTTNLNFYVVISIEVDGQARVNQQPFFTVG